MRRNKEQANFSNLPFTSKGNDKMIVYDQVRYRLGRSLWKKLRVELDHQLTKEAWFQIIDRFAESGLPLYNRLHDRLHDALEESFEL